VGGRTGTGLVRGRWLEAGGMEGPPRQPERPGARCSRNFLPPRRGFKRGCKVIGNPGHVESLRPSEVG
jgi:hypothetical protein